MTTLFLIILSTFLISLTSLVGAFALFLKEKLLNKILLILVAFSAGALIGGAFLHLIPEAINGVGAKEPAILKIFLYVIFGFCTFFILEQFINWHHHYAKTYSKVTPFSYLILISGSFHNFIDGLIIAGSFIISIPTGIAASLAVGIHEIPQEIGDFGVLVHGGFEKKKALLLNFLSALTLVLGGVVGFLLSQRLEGSIVFLLPFAAGNFIYIASSDLIPEIKEKVSTKKSLIHFSVFLLGIGLMWLLRIYT
jgi:zinc and cadmium transporter|tara:strand:+ start:1507 stop:2262 length:756 start_codon:yes stop_codon:yes gene_type:complete